MIRCNDQPGRVFAIFVLAPYILNRGLLYKDDTLIVVGIFFAIYEIFWIACAAPRYTQV